MSTERIPDSHYESTEQYAKRVLPAGAGLVRGSRYAAVLRFSAALAQPQKSFLVFVNDPQNQKNLQARQASATNDAAIILLGTQSAPRTARRGTHPRYSIRQRPHRRSSSDQASSAARTGARCAAACNLAGDR